MGLALATTVAYQAPGADNFTPGINCWQCVTGCERNKLIGPPKLETSCRNDYSRYGAILGCCKGSFDIGVGVDFDDDDGLANCLSRRLKLLYFDLCGWIIGVLEKAIVADGDVSSRINSSRLPTKVVKKLTPVTFPFGRLSELTSPISTGSLPTANTTGMVEVARLAARADAFPLANSTDTER